MIDLLKSSVLTQAAITLLVLGTIVYMLITNHPVDGQLWQLGALVTGFYFGAKQGIAQGQANALRDQLTK